MKWSGLCASTARHTNNHISFFIISTSAERFAAVAEALPDEFSKEREALIRQLSELLASQQAILLPMLVELRAALEAGNLTATSVDGAVRSIDALVGRLKAPPGAGATPGRPFDITEYTQAAEGITRAAVELQQLIGSIDAQAPQLGATLGASVAKGRSLIDYLFVRAAWLTPRCSAACSSSCSPTAGWPQESSLGQ